MIHIAQAIVVEGKYDKIKLSSILDAVILVTNGFRIFRDPEKMALIQYYARTTGVIVLTDSDRAGFQIRNYLKGAVRDGKLYHVYIPDIYGKEHRKEKPSAEGKLGVEGMRPEVLLEALRRAGATIEGEETPAAGARITKTDLYAAGLTGGADSKAARQRLLEQLDLPEHLSTNALLEVLNALMTREAFRNLCK